MRKDSDLLGELLLPDDVYYGAQTLRALQMYEPSEERINCYPSYVFAMAAIKKASAIVNGKIGVLDEQTCNAIIQACDEMIEGRFILSDTKVSNILKAVVKSEILYDLYSVCMKDFKFDDVFARSIADNVSNGGYFSMSDDNKEIVAFVTCLLLEVDKQKINLQTFVKVNHLYCV